MKASLVIFCLSQAARKQNPHRAATMKASLVIFCLGSVVNCFKVVIRRYQGQ